MNVERNLVTGDGLEISQRLSDFADTFDLRLKVNERHEPTRPEMRFYAKLDGVYVLHDGKLKGEYGNGKTEADAVRNYERAIAGKRLRIEAGPGKPDHEVNAPNFAAPSEGPKT